MVDDQPMNRCSANKSSFTNTHLVGCREPSPGLVCSPVVVLSLCDLHIVAEADEDLRLPQLLNCRPLAELKDAGKKLCQSNCYQVERSILRHARWGTRVCRKDGRCWVMFETDGFLFMFFLCFLCLHSQGFYLLSNFIHTNNRAEVFFHV